LTTLSSNAAENDIMTAWQRGL